MADHHDPCSGEGRTHWLACPCREAKAEALAKALRGLIAYEEGRVGFSTAYHNARAALAAWEGKGEGRG